MNIGVILQTKDYEKAWNAFRFASTARRQGHHVKVFLMGEGVECEGLDHPKFPVNRELQGFLALGGEILACGSCLKSRQLPGSEACPISTMQDCLDLILWADKTLTF